MHRHDPRRVGNARELRHRRGHGLVSQRRRQRVLRAGRRRIRPRHHRLRRAHGLLPESAVHVQLLSRYLAAAAATAPGAQAGDHRCRPVGESAPAGGDRRRHGDGVGARRARLRAQRGADDRAAGHRPRHAEQDPRVAGTGRARRGQPGRRGRRRCATGRALPGGRHPAGTGGGNRIAARRSGPPGAVCGGRTRARPVPSFMVAVDAAP